MNASDTIRRRQARNYFVSKINEFAKTQPDCDCFSVACTKYLTCNLKFDSYELRQLFMEGRKSYLNCG